MSRRLRAFHWAGVLFLLAGTGCLTRVALQYPPTIVPPVSVTSGFQYRYPEGDVSNTVAGTEIVLMVSDPRKYKDIIGIEIQAKTPQFPDQIYAQNDVAEWARAAIRAELTKHGYSVVEPDATNLASTIRVEAHVDKVDCNLGSDLGADISLSTVTLSVHAQRGSQEVLAKTYDGQGSTGVVGVFRGSHENQICNASLGLALEDAIRGLITDLRALQ